MNAVPSVGLIVRNGPPACKRKLSRSLGSSHSIGQAHECGSRSDIHPPDLVQTERVQLVRPTKCRPRRPPGQEGRWLVCRYKKSRDREQLLSVP